MRVPAIATVAVFACLTAVAPLAARPAAVRTSARPATVKSFGSPQQAADALVAAAETFDVPALEALFGRAFNTLVRSGEPAQDRQRSAEFAARARAKQSVSVDPKTAGRAVLIVGDENWPFPIPIVKRAGRWAFDARAGRQELLYRRIGGNELDAMEICRGYVEAQHEYALKKREGFEVNQYAQRIISTPRTQDGLAWQREDGTWDGPVGEHVARAIEQGYTSTGQRQPYHGYVFKVLTGQGPAAPLGAMDFVVKGAMIGGFALAASPAAYGVTGVKTFVVSHDGVVYEKDLGAATPGAFARMTRFNPDTTWSPVARE